MANMYTYIYIHNNTFVMTPELAEQIQIWIQCTFLLKYIGIYDKLMDLRWQQKRIDQVAWISGYEGRCALHNKTKFNFGGLRTFVNPQDYSLNKSLFYAEIYSTHHFTFSYLWLCYLLAALWWNILWDII